MYFAVDINHVPGCLKLSYVTVAEQRIFLIGVEQREVLHNDC